MMGKLFGGIQIAAGLMLLCLSGLCGAFFLPELNRNPEAILNPLVWVVVLVFIGGLAAIRQGWQRITGTYVDKRSRVGRWIGAIILMGFGAFQIVSRMRMGQVWGFDTDIGVGAMLPGSIMFLIGLAIAINLIRTRNVP